MPEQPSIMCQNLFSSAYLSLPEQDFSSSHHRELFLPWMVCLFALRIARQQMGNNYSQPDKTALYEAVHVQHSFISEDKSKIWNKPMNFGILMLSSPLYPAPLTETMVTLTFDPNPADPNSYLSHLTPLCFFYHQLKIHFVNLYLLLIRIHWEQCTMTY